MKIAVFGGSFNPPHKGHIYIAKEAMRSFMLDKVLFMVAKDPPHKSIAFGVPAQQRYELTKAALLGETGLEVSDMELRREGKSYTVDTLSALREIYPEAQLYLIVGGDMLQTLNEWRESNKIFALADIIAANRPGSLPWEKTAQSLRQTYGARVHFLDCDERDISSTMVRKRVYQAKGIMDIVPGKTAQLIYENLFYQPKEILDIAEKLKNRLKYTRYCHSLTTMAAAVELAYIWHQNGEKARLAGLLHDCAKLDTEAMLKLAKEYGVILDKNLIDMPQLIHGPVGAEVAKKDFAINDEEIIRAIRSHTVAGQNMGILEKIIYVCDKTEPQRDYVGVEEIRKTAKDNLNAAVLECMNSAIAYVKGQGGEVAKETYLARQEITEKIKNMQKC